VSRRNGREASTIFLQRSPCTLLKQWFNGDAKEQFRMDFLKCSQVYGYKSIAEVEEEEFAEKILNDHKAFARDMLADGDSIEKVVRITKLSEETVRELQAEITKELRPVSG
jgi:hypothetical protein